jgi:hypothetical protein
VSGNINMNKVMNTVIELHIFGFTIYSIERQKTVWEASFMEFSLMVDITNHQQQEKTGADELVHVQ